MTRINTNVSSLNAQKTLARSNAMLQESLTRLSTGLRINTGKEVIEEVKSTGTMKGAGYRLRKKAMELFYNKEVTVFIVGWKPQTRRLTGLRRGRKKKVTPA